MIRTAIPELTKAIEEGAKAVASFRHRPGLLECEDYIYFEMEQQVRKELICELIKAKKLIKKKTIWQRILNLIRK